MMQAEDILHDLQRNIFGDKEIDAAYENLRAKHREKGLSYTELVKSKLFGTLKYLLVELYDEDGTILITDLDTNNTYRYVDETRTVRQPTKTNVQRWIEASRAA